jgi:hypothetical protein
MTPVADVNAIIILLRIKNCAGSGLKYNDMVMMMLAWNSINYRKIYNLWTESSLECRSTRRILCTKCIAETKTAWLQCASPFDHNITLQLKHGKCSKVQRNMFIIVRKTSIMEYECCK